MNCTTQYASWKDRTELVKAHRRNPMVLEAVKETRRFSNSLNGITSSKKKKKRLEGHNFHRYSCAKSVFTSTLLHWLQSFPTQAPTQNVSLRVLLLVPELPSLQRLSGRASNIKKTLCQTKHANQFAVTTAKTICLLHVDASLQPLPSSQVSCCGRQAPWRRGLCAVCVCLERSEVTQSQECIFLSFLSAVMVQH